MIYNAKILLTKMIVVTQTGKRVVFSGNDVSRHLPETGWSYFHPGMEHPGEIGFFIVPKLISDL